MAEVCVEMRKLRDWLKENSINFWDDSDATICRTKFKIKKNRFSVIHGRGTYGGYNPFTKVDSGRLECQDYNHPDPLGFLTAEDVIALVRKELDL